MAAQRSGLTQALARSVMIHCNRCNSELSDLAGSFWSEPVLVCPACGSRHQRESRLSRILSLLVVSPFLLAFVVLWPALFVTLCLFISAKGHLSLVTVGCLGGLAFLLFHPGKHVLAATKGLSGPREVMCLEK